MDKKNVQKQKFRGRLLGIFIIMQKWKLGVAPYGATKADLKVDKIVTINANNICIIQHRRRLLPLQSLWRDPCI
jgi:hypothetical protein